VPLVIQILKNSIFEISKMADIQADFDSEEIKNKKSGEYDSFISNFKGENSIINNYHKL